MKFRKWGLGAVEEVLGDEKLASGVNSKDGNRRCITVRSDVLIIKNLEVLYWGEKEKCKANSVLNRRGGGIHRRSATR